MSRLNSLQTILVVINNTKFRAYTHVCSNIACIIVLALSYYTLKLNQQLLSLKDKASVWVLKVMCLHAVYNLLQTEFGLHQT